MILDAKKKKIKKMLAFLSPICRVEEIPSGKAL